MNSMEHDPWSYHDSYNSDSDGWDDNQWVCSNCNMRNHSMMPECEVCGLKKGEVAPIFSDIEESGHQWLFLEPGSQLLDHEKALMSDRDGYLATLDLLLRAGFSMSAANLARVVATLAAHQEHLHVNRFLPSLGVVEMLSVLKMLDAPRKMRQLKRKLDNLNEVKVSKKQTKQTKIQAQASKLLLVDNLLQITSLEQEALSKGGVTGSLSKRVRRLLADIPAVKLEFYMLNFPRQPWQEIADLVHCSPDGFKVPYFLSFMMGKDPPADSIVARVFAANAEDVKGLLEDFPNLASCYSYLRSRFKGNLQDDVKLALVRTAPLEDVLWFYEELMCSGAEDEVDRRLARGDAIETAGRSRSSYAKLMERLLLFRKMHLKFAPRLLKYTEERLRLVKVSADSRVAVLGDASSSMGVAIETATIIASLLSVCLKADLCFFNGEVFDPPCIPSSAEEVLEVTRAVRASGCTSPAAALWRYYSTWQPVDLFVCVSDEDENTPHQSMMFAEMFALYRESVNPKAKVFLVSFLRGPPSYLGKMRSSLRTKGIGCRQFRLDGARPDLSKIPQLLSMLTLETLGRIEEPTSPPQPPSTPLVEVPVAPPEVPLAPVVGEGATGNEQGGAMGDVESEWVVLSEEQI